jgi:two-component system cell cycle sensor histidine kinase/response regulator CckA
MPSTEPHAVTPRRILLVDDEPMIAETVKMLLEVDGHRVETAKDAEEALAGFAPNKFDLIISDYMMPRMKGDAMAARMRVLAPDQAIVFLTAHGGLVEGTLRIPNAKIVSKPFTLATLREAITQAMRPV